MDWFLYGNGLHHERVNLNLSRYLRWQLRFIQNQRQSTARREVFTETRVNPTNFTKILFLIRVGLPPFPLLPTNHPPLVGRLLSQSLKCFHFSLSCLLVACYILGNKNSGQLTRRNELLELQQNVY